MAVTTGMWEPASRFRVRALIPGLYQSGVACEEVIPSVKSYPPTARLLRPAWLLAALATRLPLALSSRAFDVVLFQRELISTLMTLEPLFKRPRVLDVDDAIFLSQRARSIARLAGSCDMVVCGNQYLADRFSNWNKTIRILPTGVDTQRYCPAPLRKAGRPQTIGWIGTSSNLKYLYQIEGPLSRVLTMCPDAMLVIVSDRPPVFKTISPERIHFIFWSPDVEVEAIQSFSVGLMPLDDSEWARGKCSFKLLQYYSCGVPAVVSPVGMNAEVIAAADAGFSANSTDGWVDHLMFLLENPEQAVRRGEEGRKLVEQAYSIKVIAPKLASYLKEIS